VDNSIARARCRINLGHLDRTMEGKMVALSEVVDSNTAKCAAAKQTFQDARRNLLKWQKYVRALGIATVVSSIVLLGAATLIIFGVVGLAANIGAAVGVVATVVTGAGFIWVTGQAKNADTQRAAAMKDIATYCGAESLKASIM
jgi:hypothetical protein